MGARDMSPVLPEKITVYFPGRRCFGTSDIVIPPWWSGSWGIKDVTFSDVLMAGTKFTGVPESILIIHDTCQALIGALGADPTNGPALTNLIKQIAQDFYDYRSFSGDTCIIGICSVQPVAILDYIEFMYDDDGPDSDDDSVKAIEERMRSNCKTRILTEPWTGEVQEMQHMDPDVYLCFQEAVPCIYYYGEAKCVGGGAKATATIGTGGTIASITVTDGGTYTSAPTIVITGNGTGATAMVTMNTAGTSVSTVTVSNAGTGYTIANVNFVGGGTKLQLARMKLCLEAGRLVSTFVSYDTIV